MNKPLVLVVDDNVDNITVLEELLKEFDYDFNSITESTVILDVLGYQMPDLILLDYFMPEQDGLETLKILKNHTKYSKIPVIILTADTDKETLAKFFKEGAVDFLHKPINHIELKARIDSTIKISTLNKQLEQKMAIIEKQNDQIDKFTNLIFNELNTPIEVIEQFAKQIETSEGLSSEKIKEYGVIIRRTTEGISLQVKNLLDILGVIKGKDISRI